MRFRVSRPALSTALFCILLLVFSTTAPLNAAHEVVTSSDPEIPAYGFMFDGQAADSTSDGQIGTDEENGDPTEIDQLVEMLITLAAAVQRLGL
jgi:hypothetical protein